MASVSTKVEVEGARQFKNDFQESARAVKAASAELKYFSNELNRNGASADALRNKLSALNKAYDSESEAIAKLQARLDVLTQAGAENSDEFVKLTADLYKHKDAQAQLQSEMQGTQGELDRLESGADQAGNEMKELGDKSEDAGGQIGKSFATDVAKATVILDKLVDVGIAVGKKVFEIGKGAVQYNAEMESYSRTIEAFFKTSGQGAEEAAKNTADLIANQKALSTQVGIGADKLIDANKMLIASGVNGQKSQQAISALAKAIVATGGGNEELTRMAQNLQQISNTGKASSQDLKQFALAGVDVYGLLADSTGKTVEQLKEMDITFDMITEALTLATQEGGKFYEASQVGATTLNGQVNTLQSTIREGLGTAFQPVNEALTKTLLPAAQAFVEDIDWEYWGEVVATAANLAAGALKLLGDTFNNTKEYVELWDQELMKDRNEMSATQRMHNAAAQAIVDKWRGTTNKFSEYQGTITTSVRGATSGVQQAMNGMVGSMNGAAAQAGAASNNIAAQVRSPLVGLAGEAPTWMSHFGSSLESSLRAQAPRVSGAASSIASAMRSYLAFTVPEKGPLHDYQEWMPHFVEGLADTMKDSQWRLEQASADLAQSVVNNSAVYNTSVNVYGGNQDPNTIADQVMIKIQRATNQRRAVWA